MVTLFDLSQQSLADAWPLGADGVALTAEALQTLQLEGGSSPKQDELSSGAQPREAGGASTCIACGLGVSAPGFASVEEQRAHFRTDWHRYNVKRRVAGLAPVSEVDFAALIDRDDQDVGSLSGSESGDSEVSDPGAAHSTAARGAAGPQLQFCLADGQRCAVWRCLVAPDQVSRADMPLSDASCLQQLQQLRARPSRWAVILSRGGHFAAAVFEVLPDKLAGGSKPKSQQQQQQHQLDKMEAVAHKSFHRYVVRAGQGGKQSSKDAGGKYARSAGSRLRRHNEAALERDIRETLTAWRELLAGCDLVLLHAPSSNSSTLFGGEAPLLEKTDPRIRRIPFTTRRPTYSETKRVVRVLTTLYQTEKVSQPPLEEAPPIAQRSETGQPAVPFAVPASDSGDATEAAAPRLADAAATIGSGGAGDPDTDAEAEAATAAVVAAEAAAAAAAKKAEKRARQKARQKEAKAAESAASRAAAAEAASAAAEDEISRAAMQAAALAARPQPKTATGSKAGAPAATAGPNGKASSAPLPPPRLSAKPRANEDAAVKRARAAAAAEARMKALQAASQQQQLY